MKIALIIFTIFVLQFSIFAETDIFEFKVSGDDCGGPDCPTSIKSEYVNDYLITIIRIKTNCGHVPLKPSYQLGNNEVVFSFETISPSGALARCVCGTTMVFKLQLNSKRYAGILIDSKPTDIKVKVLMDGKEIIPNQRFHRRPG